MSDSDLPRRDGAVQRAERARWAETADPLNCAGCRIPFQPKHPRQRFCKRPECPGRRAPSGAKRNQTASRRAEAARRIGVQGVLADVLLHVHTADLQGDIDEIRKAIHAWALAERSGHARERHAALVRLQSACAVRTLVVAPPPVVRDDDANT